MTDYTPEQQRALERARVGADLERAGRYARDRGIREARALGLSARAVSDGIGHEVDGTAIVSLTTVHRVTVRGEDEDQ